mmetsp:Transcript_53450/g.88762  ORF Transcript_53450/g.88762 Transcript_53450/m.88762 type:complete len:114 (+) Transcript_53450:260-601(+)
MVSSHLCRTLEESKALLAPVFVMNVTPPSELLGLPRAVDDGLDFFLVQAERNFFTWREAVNVFNAHCLASEQSENQERSGRSTPSDLPLIPSSSLRHDEQRGAFSYINSDLRD